MMGTSNGTADAPKYTLDALHDVLQVISTMHFPLLSRGIFLSNKYQGKYLVGRISRFVTRNGQDQLDFTTDLTCLGNLTHPSHANFDSCDGSDQ